MYFICCLRNFDTVHSIISKIIFSLLILLFTFIAEKKYYNVISLSN